MKRVRLFVVFVVLCLALAGGRRSAAQSGYTLVTIWGFAGESPIDVNDNGVVVGTGFTWTQAGGLQPMPLRGGAINDWLDARLQINNNGIVAGVGCGGADLCQAEIWRADFGEVPLGYFPGGGGTMTSGATGINDQGQVAGGSWGGYIFGHGPFIWSSSMGLRQLSEVNNLFGQGYAFGINANGEIVGSSGSPWTWSQAGGLILIPEFPMAVGSDALRINDSGVVVGRAIIGPDNHESVFRWSAQTGLEDLNAPAGIIQTMDINNAGDVVATIGLAAGGVVPYLYQNGVWTNINDLAPPGSDPLRWVTGINNRGWIVGFGYLLIPPNRPPSATDGNVPAVEDVVAGGTLSATDPDGDTVSFSIVANGSLGTATITNPASGSFTYTPNANANGTDTFTFKASDGALDSNVATQTVVITPVNDAPVAVDGTAVVNSGASVSGGLVAHDVDSVNLTYAVVANGTKGTATITDAGTGAYTYAANAGASGIDTVTFKANDGFLDSNTGTLRVTISPCAIAATSVAITSGPAKLDKKTGRYVQTVTLKNTGGAVSGPVSLVLDSLSANASLIAPSGTTTCAAPIGSPYVNADVGSDSLFSLRERATATLEFANPSGQPITYTPRVLSGPGSR